MRLRLIRHRLFYAVHWLLWWPFYLLYLWILRSGIVAQYGPIAIVDINNNEHDNADFTRETRDALAFIHRHDPRRFRRVARHVRFIVNRELTSAGAYDLFLRRCVIDFGRYRPHWDTAHYEWYLAHYAGTLIHEATHGYLHSRGFFYTKRTRVRIERICHNEERRFVSGLKSESYDFRDAMPPFDETLWHDYWNAGRLKHTRDLWERMRQSTEEAEREGRGKASR